MEEDTGSWDVVQGCVNSLGKKIGLLLGNVQHFNWVQAL